MRTVIQPALIAALSLAAICKPGHVSASYAFYVGRNLTVDGSVLLGGTGEEVSSHWLRIVDRSTHPKDATVTVGVTEQASIPGKLFTIPQVPRTARYIANFYSDYQGFPAPLTNGGLNEFGVAARDVWAPSRRELVTMTPTPQRGPNYSDLSRLVMERAKSARHAAQLVGELIDRYGYSTYGGNSHLFADAKEGWVLLEYAGGKGLWVAERLGPDQVRVLYPGYIGKVPKDYAQNPNFMGSKNLIKFAIEQGWYDPNAGKPFDAHKAYGLQGRDMRSPKLKYVDQRTLEADLLALAPNISVEDLMRFVRDPRIADDEAGYGQVAHLRAKLAHPDLGVLWVAPTSSIAAPFVPFWIGSETVPEEWGQHRYLTKDAGRTFLNPVFQHQEASLFAGRLFKRLLYYTCAHPKIFLPEVTQTLRAFEAQEQSDQATIERTARILYAQKEPRLARQLLSRYSVTKAREALQMGDALLQSIETRTRLVHGVFAADPDQPINAKHRATVSCREPFTRNNR